MIKTALYFGSFNPVHRGHLTVAAYVTQYADIDELWFVPTPENPLKNKGTLAPYDDRYKMLELATEHFPFFRISGIENALSKPNYTCHTLEKLSELYPGREFVLLIGADIIGELPRWRNYRRILENYRILLYPRAPYKLENPYPEARMDFLDNAPQIEISSSLIRSGIKNGNDILPFVPKKVAAYIKKQGLYL